MLQQKKLWSKISTSQALVHKREINKQETHTHNANLLSRRSGPHAAVHVWWRRLSYEHLRGVEDGDKGSNDEARREVEHEAKEDGDGESRQRAPNNAQDDARQTQALRRRSGGPHTVIHGCIIIDNSRFQ